MGVGGAVASETGTFTNVLFSGNTAVFIGGAAFVTDATFIDVVFANNNSLQQAGAVGAYGTCVFTNVVFEGNTGDDGGAVRNYGSAVFTNVTFTDNSALNGGALNNDTGSSPTIINTILWNNTASVTGPEIHNVGGATPSISYSLIEGSGGSGGGWDTALGTDGGNNIDADPLFVNAATADLRLMALSAARDAGDDAAPNLPASDLDGNPRTDGPAVDMGAYEYQVPCPPANVVFVDAMASGTHTGVSWVDAVSDLQLALITADECAMVTEVHVAEGTYVPGDPGDRAATFELREGVSFYGGYPNGGGTPDPAAHETILSGDISSPPDMVNTDNSYNVVTVGAGISAATVVDGFTIRDGYADGVSYPTNVAGAVNVTVAGSTPTFNTMRFLNNYSSGGTGAVFSQGGTMTNVVFDGNSTGNGSGAFTLWAGTLAMTDAVFTNNTAVLGGGGGFAAAGATSFTFTNVEFRDNTSTTANGGAFIALSSGSFVNALFQDNSCPLNGGAILVDDGGSGPPHVDFTNVTFTENDGTLQGGAIAYGSATSSIINGIFWNNTSNGLPEIAPAVPGNISIRHSLIQGSNGSGGSWNGVLGVDLGGNIDADPVFVDAATGDLHLAPTSPAINAGDNAAANLPVTDLDASPRISGAHVDMGPYEFGLAMEITSISDVGNDQGGFVRVQWNRASLDVIGSAESILEYSVWRLANPAPKPETSSKAEANPEHMTGPLPPGTWDMLTTIPATTDLTYSTVVTTTCDSTVGAGQCFSTFLIRAHTQFPSVVYESAPDSGYSVDNLAPGPPMMALAGSLSSWSHSSAPDFAYYTIYSVPEQHTLLDPDYMVATTTDTTVVLPDSTTGEYIVVTATDTSGNESEESNRELHQTPTSVGNVSPPSKTALHQNAPNPFNPSTRISFDVASATRVTLRIFDVSGRHVRTLVDRDMIPNRYDIVWNGTNDHGSRVASGVYVYRLEAGEFAEQRKMLMLK